MSVFQTVIFLCLTEDIKESFFKFAWLLFFACKIIPYALAYFMLGTGLGSSLTNHYSHVTNEKNTVYGVVTCQRGQDNEFRSLSNALLGFVSTARFDRQQCLGHCVQRSLRSHVLWVWKGVVIKTDVSMD